MTTAEELDLVNTALRNLYEAGMVEEYSEASERARKARYADLTARKDQLEAKLAGETGAAFKPIVPLD